MLRQRFDEFRHAGHRLGIGIEPGCLELGVGEREALRLDQLAMDLGQGRCAGDDVVPGRELAQASEGAGGVGAVTCQPLGYEVVIEGDDDAEQVEDEDFDFRSGNSHRPEPRAFGL